MGVTYFPSKVTLAGEAENGSLWLSSGCVWDHPSSEKNQGKLRTNQPQLTLAHPSSGRRTKRKFRVPTFVADNQTVVYVISAFPPLEQHNSLPEQGVTNSNLNDVSSLLIPKARALRKLHDAVMQLTAPHSLINLARHRPKNPSACFHVVLLHAITISIAVARPLQLVLLG